MRSKFFKIALAADFVLVLAFIFGCTTDRDPPRPMESYSSSSEQCNASLFAGGNGTEANPYQISTAEQLQNLNLCFGTSHDYPYYPRYQNNHYVLTRDVDDLSSYLLGAGNNGGKGWEPIGNSDNPFCGKFNGNGHKVSGLWINRPSQSSVGLFGDVWDFYGAEIKNIGVEIDDSKGGVKGNGYVGGLVGSGGNISNSYVTGNVEGYSEVGGLVGSTSIYSTISNSYATGNVSGTETIGGLVGYNSGTISNSYATGNVTDSYDKDGASSTDGTGGLVGINNGTVSDSYATGNVKGDSDVGGLVGDNWGTISNSYATGSVIGNEAVGGLAGNSARATISSSYATGNVSGSSEVGGLVGELFSASCTISNSYSIGRVFGTGSYVGGLVGYEWGKIINSYCNEEILGEDYGCIKGKTTAEMKTQSTYEGWDFENIWKINPAKNNGYPILQYLESSVSNSGSGNSSSSVSSSSSSEVPSSSSETSSSSTATLSSSSGGSICYDTYYDCYINSGGSSACTSAYESCINSMCKGYSDAYVTCVVNSGSTASCSSYIQAYRTCIGAGI